jgi:hypothetical protein
MDQQKEDESSCRAEMKRRITAKLALGSLWLVLGATTIVMDTSEGQTSIKSETPVIERLESLRSKLRARNSQPTANSTPLDQIAQWYNWPNWPNWPNFWGNYPWGNWRNF